MPTPQAIATTQQAKQFADGMAALVREKLRTLPERQMLAYLDALRDTVEFELWVARMELDAVAGPAQDETAL